MVILNRLYYLHLIKRKVNNTSFKGKRHIIKLINYLTPKMKDNIIVKTKYGFKLKISPIFDKGIERSIFNKGVYEDGTLWCFNKIIKKNFIIADVGANIGLTSIHASKLVGSKGVVYAFEPLKSTFKILKENIKLNKLKNILVKNIALSDFEGITLIYENLHINRGAASIFPSIKKNGIEIEVTTLNSFCSINNISKFDFIKIDIEGAELPMLKGGDMIFLSSIKPILCIEYSVDVKSDYNPELIYEFLKETCEYRIFKQKHGKESLSPLIEVKSKMDLPFHDNLYCFREYHFELLPKNLFLNIT